MFERRAASSAAVNQRRRDTASAGAAMHEELGEVGAVRLVLGLRQAKLHRPDDTARILRDKQGARPCGGLAGNAVPKRMRLRAGQGMHQADRGAGRHAVDQHLGKLIELAWR